MAMLMRFIRRAAWITGAVFAAFLFFAAGAFLRLLIGPISLGPVAGAIEDSINRAVTGFVVRFDSAVLEWSRTDQKIYLTVLGTRIFDLNGRIVAQAPKANLDFSEADLLAGKLSLRRFALVGVQLTGVRTADGTVKLGFGREKDSTDILKILRTMLQSGGGDGSLDGLSVRNARLAFHDEPTGLFIVSPDTNFTLESGDEGLNASVDSAVEISGAASRLALRASLRDDGTPKRGSVEIRGLSLPALSKNNPSLAYLQPYNITSDIQAGLEFGDAGELKATTFRVEGAGSITGPVFRIPLRLEKFAIEGGYDGAADRVTVESLSVQGKPLATKLRASIVLARTDGSVSGASGDFVAENTTLAFPGLFRENLAFSNISLKLAFDYARQRIAVERATIRAPAIAADLNGAVTFAKDSSPALTVHGSIEPISVRDLLRYWPSGVGVGAEAWIKSQVLDGRAGPVRIEANFAPGALDRDIVPEGALLLSFPFESMSVRYLGEMTPLTQARGEAQLTGEAFRAKVSAGAVGPIAVSDGDLEILDYNSPSASARIKVRTDGQVGDMLALIDEKPLGYTKRFRIDPAKTQGGASVNLDFAIPLLKDVPIDRVSVGVQAKISGLSVAVDEHRRLENASVQIALNKESLTSQGTGDLAGVPVNFRWTENFNVPDRSTRVDLTGRLDDGARARLGLSEPSWLKGSMPVRATFTGQRFAFTEAAVSADLTQASAEFGMFNLIKRVGVPAAGSALVHFAPNGTVAVNDLVISGEGVQARGALSLNEDGSLIKVSLANLKSGDANEFALDLEPLQGGGLSIRLQGKSLDATKIFGDGETPPGAATPIQDRNLALVDPLLVTLRLDRILFKNDLAFRDVAGSVSFSANERITGFSLDALGPTGGKIKGSYGVDAGVRSLALDAEDAGAFVRTFTGFTSIRGGSLTTRVSFPSDAAPKPYDYLGDVTLNDFVVTDQPFLARLFAAGSLDGPLRLLQGEGIRLARLNAPFTSKGRVITFDDGRASGPSVGGTFEGVLDRRNNQIGLTGTMVPAYGINSMLGAVPILGGILASRKGEGVFGVTYAMKGPLDDPTLMVNPLSVLTPGILRRIFEFTPAKAPPQDEPQPEAAAP
jgi:hypothetical protein